MKKETTIFVVEDDRFFGSMVAQLFKDKYQKVFHFETGQGCISHLNEKPDIVILDHHLGETNGIEVLRKIKSFDPNIEVIFLSAQEKLSTAIQSLKYGAYDYLEKNNANLQRLQMLVKRISQHKAIVSENKSLKYARTKFLAIYTIALLTIVTLYILYPNIFGS